MAFSDRLDAAFSLAHDWHRAQRRKGRGVPYVSHLMAVAALVADHGGDEDQVIAALLHDAAEDAGGQAALDAVREQFGERVEAYVDACSDTAEHPKPPWRPRKEAFIAGVAGQPAEVKLIVAADKLHNATCTLRDLRRHGRTTWDKFSGKEEGSLWYYRALSDALGQGWRHPILDELRDVVERLEAATGELG